MVLERVTGGGDQGGLTMKAVIFAEPGAMVQHNNETGLLPGDRLLEVNGVAVGGRSREDIIDMIKASGNSVTLKVSKRNFCWIEIIFKGGGENVEMYRLSRNNVHLICV